MLTIDIQLGSDCAECSWAVQEYPRSIRAAFFDEYADALTEELENSYPEAEVTVTCKPNIERLRGEATDIIVSGQIEDDANLVAMQIEDVVNETSEDFFDDRDALDEIADDMRESIDDSYDDEIA